jgi:hypothetical protein
MKRILILITIAISAKVMGQDASAGPKVGVNISSLSNTGNSKSLTGINAGGFFIYSIAEHFGVSGDVLYSGEGAKFTSVTAEGSDAISVESKLRLNYIRVPLLANIFFGSLGDKLRPKISLGPSLGFLTGVSNMLTTTTTSAGMVTAISSKSTDKSGFSSFDFSALVGAGLNYKVGDRTWLNLDARYSIGASDIHDVKVDNESQVKNNVFSVAVGLAFGLGSE